MHFCLNDPEFGYYRNVRSLGQAGDFVTSSEISQIFGECIGFWLLDLWQRCNKPNSFIIVELGGGKGTAMHDVLSLLKNSPAFDSLQIIMVEMNPHFQALQKSSLVEFTDKITWLHDFDSIPVDSVHALIANEFLDCLPIQQFQFSNNTWHERYIKINEGTLQICLEKIKSEPESLPCSLPSKNPSENDILEHAPDMPKLMKKISNLVSGGALLIDYGYELPNYGDTLQAIKQQKYTTILPPLESLTCPDSMPDLSAHVNFAAVANEMTLQPLQLMTQHEFLSSMGGALRLQKLLQKAKSKKQKIELTQAYQRISQQMGQLFKVLMAYSQNLAQ